MQPACHDLIAWLQMAIEHVYIQRIRQSDRNLRLCSCLLVLLVTDSALL